MELARMRRRHLAVTAVLMVGVAGSAGCDAGPTGAASVGPDTLVLTSPPEGEGLTRWPVPFDHGIHTQALATEGCARCHLEGKGRRALEVVDLPETASRDDWMDAYHGLCLGCHDERQRQGASSGPLGCGDCHRPVASASPAGPHGGHEAEGARAHLRFDYSLHDRHASIPDTECGQCHHVLDETSGKLVAKPGTESACTDCHEKADEGRKLSWRHSAHVACIGCHQEEAAKPAKGSEGNAGKPPVDCEGCHDAARIAAIKRIENPSRPARGQPERVWLASSGERAWAVSFDHLGHEPLTKSCSSCHHASLEKCSRCHTDKGAKEGGWISLEMAQHEAGSSHSCVGCHARTTAEPRCAGCHGGMPEGPSSAACERCHEGADETIGLDEAPPPRVALPDAVVPPVGKGFPEELTIDLPGDFGPSPFPHAKIVADMLERLRGSRLASFFHAEPGTLCAGCHHHSPVGTQPPACSSCHGVEHRAGNDLPTLKAAYHRQCIGCHERMNIGHTGCTDCHAEKTEEKAP